MPRALVLGNGSLTVNFDSRLVLREILYPHVGMKNHVQGRRNMVGLWEGGRFSWIDSDDWARSIRYASRCLVSMSTAAHAGMGIEMAFSECVHYRENVLLRRVLVANRTSMARHLRLFFVNDLCIDESDIGDSAYYDPSSNAIVHYKRGTYFCFSGRACGAGFSEYTVGKKRHGGVEGTWRDAEDGRLEGHGASHGSIDSTVAFWLEIGANEAIPVSYWMCAAAGEREIMRINSWVSETGVDALIGETESYWRRWLSASAAPSDLPEAVEDCYRLSLMLARAALDRSGGLVASTDMDIMTTNRDNYAYVWPRDAALTARSLAMAGHPDCSGLFLEFAARTIDGDGFFWPKYQADGTVGPSWHSRQGRYLPIQEDETGLVLFLAGEHLRLTGDVEFLSSIYPRLVRPAARFLARYRDARSGLPLPSHDLWEERSGVFTWTSAFVCAGLRAAGDLASVFEPQAADEFHNAASAVREGMTNVLLDRRLGRFIRGYIYNHDRYDHDHDRDDNRDRGGVLDGGRDGSLVADPTVDSSMYGLLLSGVFDPTDVGMAGTLASMKEGLWVGTGIGGVCRYPGDWYFSVAREPSVPGNPWIISTLWLASWLIATARSPGDLRSAARLIEWAASRGYGAGILPEQVNPFTGEPLSVAPLTWSHSTFVGSVIDYRAKWSDMKGVVRAE